MKEFVPLSNVPSYLSRLKGNRAKEIYTLALKALKRDRNYRDPKYTIQCLANDLHTNTRYVAAAIAMCTGGNYRALVNQLRLKDVVHMMSSRFYTHLTTEEIGLLAGFASRQMFYKNFSREFNLTPRQYRLQLQQEALEKSRDESNPQQSQTLVNASTETI